MYFKSKRISLVILGITAMVNSRALFAFFDDPEGPNLLVVTVLAGILYCLSVAVYLRDPAAPSVFRQFPPFSLTGLKRLLVAIILQVILVVVLYFSLR